MFSVAARIIRKLLCRKETLPPWTPVLAALAVPLAKNAPCLVAVPAMLTEGLCILAMVAILIPLLVVIVLSKPRRQRREGITGITIALRIMAAFGMLAALPKFEWPLLLACLLMFVELWWLDCTAGSRRLRQQFASNPSHVQGVVGAAKSPLS